MPEVFQIETRKIPILTVETPRSDDNAKTTRVIVNDTIDDNGYGFKITGGAEFGMPITVFHVMLID